MPPLTGKTVLAWMSRPMDSGDCGNSVHVAVFNPTSPSCWGVQMALCYRHRDGEKHHTYEPGRWNMDIHPTFIQPQEGWELWPIKD